MKTVTAIAAALLATAALGAAQQLPARDRAIVPTSGTLSIAGLVVNDATPAQPVRRAIVTISGSGLVPSRSAVTDNDGRFGIERLPAGRYQLSVSRSGFVTTQYGAKRPGRPGTAVTLDANTPAEDVVIRIWRAGVIAGIVRDERGVPAPNVPVFAVPERRSTPGSLTLSNNGVSTGTPSRRGCHPRPVSRSRR